LGLTLARDIVEFHGGSIEANSAGTGQGSEFIVRLPLSDAPAPDATDPVLHAASPALRIVVVDDNKAQSLTLQRLLQAMGHRVRIAYDAHSAMKLLADFVPHVGLIDLGLPTISGYELARWMREQRRLDKVMLVAQTGWGREEDRSQSREAGFDHHLVKPIDHQHLVNILAQLQDKRDQFL
jgi:CheY-like chemotaxis protein